MAATSLKLRVSTPLASRFELVRNSFTMAPSRGVPLKSFTSNGKQSVFHSPSLYSLCPFSVILATPPFQLQRAFVLSTSSSSAIALNGARVIPLMALICSSLSFPVYVFSSSAINVTSLTINTLPLIHDSAELRV